MNILHRCVRHLVVAAAVVLAQSALAITETWSGTFSNTDPVKVFSKVTTLAQLKELAAAGQLGGKMGGSGFGTLQKTFGAVVFDSETATSVTYQMQVNDFRGDNDKHLKVCWVEFTELDGGIGAKQTNQCYCNNQGPTLLGQKITSSSTGYSPNTFANYQAVEFKIVENPLDAKTTNILLWLDASAEDTIEKTEYGKVTKWKSVHDANQYAVPTASSEADGIANINNSGFKSNFGNYAEQTEGELGSIHECDGKPAFDMGGIASGVDMSYARKTTIRTIFWVMDIVQNNNAFFLGDGSSYDFHRNGANYANSQGAFGNANCKIWCDGVRVPNNQSTAVPTGRHVFATVTHQNFASNHFSLDRNVTDGNTKNGSRHGGRKLSELVIIDTPLSDVEVATTMAELGKKWMASNEFVITTASSDEEKTMARTIGGFDTLIIDGTDATEEDPLVVSGQLVINGTLITRGQVKIAYGDIGSTAGATIVGSMVVESGKAVVKFADRGLKGTLTIAEGATLKPYGYVDAADYSGSSTVNVYGSLDMTDERGRWTLRAANVMNFYPGSQVFGNGQKQNETTWHGALQFNSDNCVMNFKKDGEKTGTVKFNAKLRPNNPFVMNVEEGMVVEMAGSLGNDNKAMIVRGAGKVVVKSAYAFNAATTVEEGATLEIAEGGELSNGVSGSGKVILSAANLSFGTTYRAPLKITFPESASVSLTATAAETADGEILLNTTAESLEGLTFTVGETTVPEENLSLIDGELTISLKTQSVKETKAVSEWPQDWTGVVSVKNDNPEQAITMTVDAAFPAGVTTVNLFGKVDVVYMEGASAEQSVTLVPQTGAEISVTGVIANTINVPSGLTLKTKGETMSAGKISNSGTVEVADGMLTLSAGTLGGTITIDKGATIKFGKDHAIGNTVVLNVYGTLDLTAATWFDSNSAPGNVLNLYAGSKIVGGNCGMVMTGGYSNTINIKQYAEAEVNYVLFDVKYHTSSYGAGYSTTFAIENDNSKPKVGLKITKPFQRNGTVIVSGAHIQGLYLDCSKEVKLGNNNRCLHGDITIKSGTTLVMQGGDMIPYHTTNDFVLNLYGTLNCGGTRQTLSAEGGDNVINLFDGARIIGTGAANGGYTSILDVFQNQLITVSGTATIEGPIGFRNTTNLQVAMAEGAESAVLVIKNPVLRNAKIDLQPGAKVQLPNTVETTKVITTVRGKMVKSNAVTEDEMLYRTVDRAFVFLIK